MVMHFIEPKYEYMQNDHPSLNCRKYCCVIMNIIIEYCMCYMANEVNVYFRLTYSGIMLHRYVFELQLRSASASDTRQCMPD